MKQETKPLPTVFARCWAWLTDGLDCAKRDDGAVCYACARHLDVDPS